MYNVSEVIINNIDIKQNRKYYYKANFSNAVTNIRLYLRNKLKEELVSRIKKFLILQQPERAFKRAIINFRITKNFLGCLIVLFEYV